MADQDARGEEEMVVDNESGPAAEVEAPRSVPRVGAWNAQSAAFVRDCVAASKLFGGGDVTVRYGGVEATIAVKHTRADGDPELLESVRRMQLQRVAAQQQRIEIAAEKSVAQKEAKRLKRKAQKEKKKLEKISPN